MGIFCTLYGLSRQDALDALGLAAANPEESRHQPRPLQPCKLDKAWGAIHYFLSGSADTNPGNPRTEDFLLSGKRLEGISEPVALHMPEEVIALATVLKEHSSEDLIARFDATRMNELAVYGEPWDESGQRFVLPFLEKFRAFVLSAAEQRLAVLIVMA